MAGEQKKEIGNQDRMAGDNLHWEFRHTPVTCPGYGN